jgi:hypothetical protein
MNVEQYLSHFVMHHTYVQDVREHNTDHIADDSDAFEKTTRHGDSAHV